MEYIRRFFTYDHLPPLLREVSKQFADLAAEMDDAFLGSVEKSAGLRKLLEAKDCFMRAALDGAWALAGALDGVPAISDASGDVQSNLNPRSRP